MSTTTEHPHLTAAHLQQLRASAISDAIIKERGYRSIPPGAAALVRQLAGVTFSERLLRTILHQGALALPIYRLGASEPALWMLRPDQPRVDARGHVVKYEWPRSQPNVLDTLPRYRTQLGDPAVRLCLVEGIKKTDAVATAYGEQLVPVTMNGVFGWRGRNAQGGTTASADLECIAWHGRTVWLFPDGDVRFNPHVLQAIERLSRLLSSRYGVAEVLVLQLPMRPDEPKVGVDDFLAAGHTTQELETHLSRIAAVSRAARVPMGIHPETHSQLFLPPGYTVEAQTICRLDARGQPQPIYTGGMFVREVGVDLLTHAHTAMLAWNGRGDIHGEVTVPTAALSDPRAFSQLVGGAGAAIGPRNIKDVMQFLVEFIQENINVIPRRPHADRLALVEGGLVLPGGAVGLQDNVRYTGRPSITVGADADAYPQAVRAALSWQNSSAFWLALGLSLAAPALARMRLRRNPVLYLGGESGSGKTTLLQFATGCYGDPTRHPFRIEASRTTLAGIFQTLESLGGLPALVDDAHTVPEPKRLESACYAFANGQRYTVGSLDGKARGGTPLDGTLFLAGEAIVEFKHAGARLRVLWIDAGAWLPLGVEARSDTGQARARILEQAWEAGAGCFGKAIAERIWCDWAAFACEVRELETDAALAPLQAWRQPLAAAAAALNAAFQVAQVTQRHIPDPASWIGRLLDDWSAMLTAGHNETDPATEAWEALLAQGRRCDNSSLDAHTHTLVPATWEWIEADRGGGVIACRRAGDSYWRVITSTPQFKERVHVQAAQLYGQTWLARGWIRPGRAGTSTDIQRVHTGESVRVLCIPLQMLESWHASVEQA